MAKLRLDFVAVERWLWPQELCREHFLFMTCLRDPMSRIKSNIKFHRLQSPQLVMDWATKQFFNPAAPISNGSPSVDNFYVRSFAGQKTYLKPLGEVTVNDLSKAMEMLSKFEVVLILEKLNTRDVGALSFLLNALPFDFHALPLTQKPQRPLLC